MIALGNNIFLFCPDERCTCLWLTFNILRNRASQKTSSSLSRAKSFTWIGTNHRTVFNLLIFAARKKDSLRNLEFSGFQFYYSRDPECRFINKLLYSIGNPASSLHNKVCFFSTSRKLTYVTIFLQAPKIYHRGH